MKLVKQAVTVVALVIGAGVASANDFGNGQGFGQGNHSAMGDVVGNADGEGEASFTMSFSARGKSKGDFAGKGNTNTDMNGNFYGSDREYYYRPVK